MKLGVIGDSHLPFEKEGYLDFCYDVFDFFKVERVIHIGDFIDNHAISFHDHDPDGYSTREEIEVVKNKTQRWFNTFPELVLIKGNHDELPERRLLNAGISSLWLKEIKDVFSFPKGWEVEESLLIDNVLYEHGTGFTGKTGALDKAKLERLSCVIGHSHGFAGVQFHSSKRDTIFGMNVGCGIDKDSYAFKYGKNFKNQPVLSCGVVLEGEQALCLRMEGKWES